ncbi:MAG TPA: hypothetical protein VG983_06875, partial [Caulobacterales bacterium]|nr:hypothetical protein [Caulobacterales bacterium]
MASYAAQKPDVEAGCRAYRAGNHQRARQIFEAAADLGRPEGLHHLALLYWRGEGGVERSPTHAAALFHMAADAGYGPSLFNLGVLHARGEGAPNDEEAAFRYFERAATGGFLDAMFQLGQAYRKGQGVAA